jgi:phosphatidate cytidylyltransferase
MAVAPPDPARWSDLRTRLTSAAAMVVVGSVVVVAGGIWFQMVTVFISAVMIWELWSMIEPKGHKRGTLLAAMVASVLSGLSTTAPGWEYAIVLVVPVVGAIVAPREKMTFFLYALAIQIAGWGLVHFRVDYGFVWLLWMILCVVATDVAGYFVGRAVGGPKFWPRISPKKTWSGTAGGWAAAALVGLLFDMFFVVVGPEIIVLSVLVSFAGQMGDIAESAVKRRMGVKDASALIPGHGGLWDRFDALLGASLFMILMADILGRTGLAQ